MSKLFSKIFGLTPFRLSMILTALMIFLFIINPSFLEIIELKALDLRFVLRGPMEPGPEVVIAAIDEKSVDEIGRWPWPRVRIAELIQALNDDGAQSVAFDVGFWEHDINTNIGLIDRLDQEIKTLGLSREDIQKFLALERNQADNDLLLARTLSDTKVPVTLGYFFHMQQDQEVEHISPETVQDKIKALRNAAYSFTRLMSANEEPPPGTFIEAFLPESNIPILSDAATASGYFNMFPDADGTVRWVPMTIKCQDKYYLPLSLQGLRFFMGGVPASLNLSAVGVESVSIGDKDVMTDENARLLVNYRGPSKTFPHYSITDIINKRFKPGTFKNRIVLVGATAVGIYDLRVTPFDSVFPGIEIHANVIDNVLNQDFLIRPGWAAIYDLFTLLIIGLLVGLLYPRLAAITGIILGLVILGGWSGVNYYFFTKGIWVNFIYPVLTTIMLFTGLSIYRYMTEEREKKKIRGAFSYYVNPTVVAEMLKNPDMLKLGGDKRIMTVLFSDIRGFTTISENMEPEALVQILNEYLTEMTNIVFKYDGLVDKYIGDAVMAFWGAPLSQPKHALLACQTGLDMMSSLAELRAKWKAQERNLPFLDIGIGLNSGPMVVGNMGSDTRFDYTVMGDSVNLGSRLEGANKQYGTHIILGEMTFEQVKEHFICRELDSVAVKGKERPERIFELMGAPDTIDSELLHLARAFTRGVKAYKSCRWDEAIRIFSALKAYYPEDHPSAMYLDRANELKASPPPPNWDCVFVMKTK